MKKLFGWINHNQLEIFIVFVIISNLIGFLFEIWNIDMANSDSFLANLNVIVRVPLSIILLIIVAICWSLLQFIYSLIPTAYFYLVKWLYYKYYIKKQLIFNDEKFIYVFWVFTFSIINIVVAFKYHSHLSVFINV
jgi:hypothetical protein